MSQRVVVDGDVLQAVSPLFVGDGTSDDARQIVVGQRLHLEDAAAADQSFVDLEIRILGRRADERHRTILDVRKQRVLLRFVEAVHLVDEQNRPLSVQPEPIVGTVDGSADVFDAREDGVEREEVFGRTPGDDASERRLPRSRRTVEQQARHPVGFDGATQQFARPQDVRLTGELVERTRTHPVGERSRRRRAGAGGEVEQIVGHMPKLASRARRGCERMG